jgi:hypothetical protein
MEKNNLRETKWPTITFDWDTSPSEQWLEWLEYFECQVEQVPVTMREMIDGQRPKKYEFTVPTEFPVLFDPTFRPNPNWTPPKRPASMDADQMREKVAELKARYGPNWGIKQFPSGSKRKPWTPPTDDELRAKYGRRHDEPEGLEF